MRKSPSIAPRKCEMCGLEYTPKGPTQKYCKECRVKAERGWKTKYYRKMYPNVKPKQKTTTPCCVCGGTFSGMFDGKPYCNKHWLRMYNNGDLEERRRPNTCKFEVRGDRLLITTANGKKIIADADKCDLLSQHSWCFDPKGYAVANIGGCVTPMHRLLLGLEHGDKRVGDHINRRKFDNRMENLRICTALGNARNVSPAKGSQLGELGIRLTKHGTYNVRIQANGKVHHIGNFSNLEDAREARKRAEDIYHGEYASHIGTEKQEVDT